jgi:hypothetical protein
MINNLYPCFLVTGLSIRLRNLSLGSVLSDSRSEKLASLLLVRMSHSRLGRANSRFLTILEILLLLRWRDLNLGSLGKPSTLTMPLSDRSMVSNWFWEDGGDKERGRVRWERDGEEMRRERWVLDILTYFCCAQVLNDANSARSEV